MQIQTIAFELSDMTYDEACNFVHLIELAAGELPGLAAQTHVRIPGTSRFIALFTWEQRIDVTRFRHSEIYARFAMSHHLDSLEDHDEEVTCPRAGADAALLAAA